MNSNGRPAKNIAGQMFHRWLVIARASAPGISGSTVRWFCVCLCGKSRVVDGSSLRLGTSKSCGCHKTEVLTQIKTTHGESRFKKADLVWAEDVKKRDNYTCQFCGQEKLQGKNCHAHHLQSVETHPELRYDTSNGATACASCHRKETNKEIRSCRSLSSTR